MTAGLDILGPGGSLAAAIPHYEDRAEQRAMSAAVAQALADDRPLLVEAGTGTGKTLAYLVPALASGKRVIVSTGTRTLQDQIATHDLPLLRALIDRPFTAVVLKGVANYVCRRRLDEVRLRANPHPHARALAMWADESPIGDRAEIDWLADDDPVWAEVTVTPDTRIGPRCPYFERCFVTGARRAATTADLILVNHHLYFADLALRANYPGARVLPDHDAVIFDEAHQLEDVATEHFGARISTVRLGQLVRDAHAALGRIDLFAGRAAGEVAVHGVERAAAGLFARVRDALLRLGAAEGRVTVPPDLLSARELQDAWFRLDSALEELAQHAEAEAMPPPLDGGETDDELAVREQLAALARRARQARDDLAELAEQRSNRHVYWGDVRGGAVFLCASPIQVADLLRRHVVNGAPTALFTSATLTVSASFAFTRRRLGLERDEVDELAVASPFDYARQAMLYVPRDLPEPGRGDGDGDPFSVAAAARIAELLAITAGRAFCLFTSHRALRDAAARLTAAKLPYPLLVQGAEPRASLIARFRASVGDVKATSPTGSVTRGGAVLLGTGSFWEGVDVPGDALSLVVIDRLPFAPPTDPLIAARMKHVEQQGGVAFDEVQLPDAAIALKQGFGRLIRRRDDRGIVAVLDPRIVTRAYGRVFVATLPAGLPRTSSIEQVRRWWTPAPSPAPTQA